MSILVIEMYRHALRCRGIVDGTWTCVDRLSIFDTVELPPLKCSFLVDFQLDFKQDFNLHFSPEIDVEEHRTLK